MSCVLNVCRKSVRVSATRWCILATRMRPFSRFFEPLVQRLRCFCAVRSPDSAGISGRGSATCDHCRPLKKLNVLVLMSTDSAKFCAEPTTRKGCSTWNDTWYRPAGVLLRTTEDRSPFTRRYHGIGMAPILERLKVPLFLSKLKAPRVNLADCRFDFFLNFGGFTLSGRLPVMESNQFWYAVSKALPVC